MIEIKYFLGREPSIGYTDQRFVYISVEVPEHERETLIKHEKCHMWLRHDLRRPQNAEVYQWMVACDIEIALNIYNAEDEAIIHNPNNVLYGGITRKNLEKNLPNLPKNLRYAEEIYDWLIENSESIDYPQRKSQSDEIQDRKDGEETEAAYELVEAALEEIKKDIEKLEAQRKIKTQKHEAQGETKKRKHSLAGLLEPTIKKHFALARKSSYKRPSRRESDFIKKGTTTVRRTPHIFIYLDRSGSFDATKTSDANGKIKKILSKYRHTVSNSVFYFNDTILDHDTKKGDGGTNYKAVVNHIIDNAPQIAIVITDDDHCEDLKDMGKLITDIIVYPIGCRKTHFAQKINSMEIA